MTERTSSAAGTLPQARDVQLAAEEQRRQQQPEHGQARPGAAHLEHAEALLHQHLRRDPADGAAEQQEERKERRAAETHVVYARHQQPGQQLREQQARRQRHDEAEHRAQHADGHDVARRLQPAPLVEHGGGYEQQRADHGVAYEAAPAGEVVARDGLIAAGRLREHGVVEHAVRHADEGGEDVDARAAGDEAVDEAAEDVEHHVRQQGGRDVDRGEDERQGDDAARELGAEGRDAEVGDGHEADRGEEAGRGGQHGPEVPRADQQAGEGRGEVQRQYGQQSRRRDGAEDALPLYGQGAVGRRRALEIEVGVHRHGRRAAHQRSRREAEIAHGAYRHVLRHAQGLRHLGRAAQVRERAAQPHGQGQGQREGVNEPDGPEPQHRAVEERPVKE